MDSCSQNTHTRQRQFEILADFMCAHSDLAKRHIKTADAKQTSNKLWKRLGADLNTAGPPMRDVIAWKKIWADHKTYIKAKLRKNKANISGTGGGPIKLCSFTPQEQQAIELLQIDEAVLGMSGTKQFGSRPDPRTNTKQDMSANTVEMEKIDYNAEEIYTSLLNDSDTQDSQNNKEKNTPSCSRVQLTSRTKTSLRQKQANNQIEYQNNTYKTQMEINDNLKEVQR